MPPLSGLTTSLGMFGMRQGARGLDYTNPLSWILLAIVAGAIIYVICRRMKRK